MAWNSEGYRILYGTLESDQKMSNEIWLMTKNATYDAFQHGELPKNVTYGVNVKFSITFFVGPRIFDMLWGIQDDNFRGILLFYFLLPH